MRTAILLYSNQLDIEGLIACTSTWQKTALHPETIHSVIQAYGEVQPNLVLHAPGWPTAAELQARSQRPARVRYGSHRARSHVRRRHCHLRAAERSDARPLCISLWGGAKATAARRGYLYFRWKGKLKALRSVELLYVSADGTLTLKLLQPTRQSTQSRDC